MAKIQSHQRLFFLGACFCGVLFSACRVLAGAEGFTGAGAVGVFGAGCGLGCSGVALGASGAGAGAGGVAFGTGAFTRSSV